MCVLRNNRIRASKYSRNHTQVCAGKFKRNRKECILVQTYLTCTCNEKSFVHVFPSVVVNGGQNEFEHNMLQKIIV